MYFLLKSQFLMLTLQNMGVHTILIQLNMYEMHTIGPNGVQMGVVGAEQNSLYGLVTVIEMYKNRHVQL